MVQVIFSGTYWARQWSLLLEKDDGEAMRSGFKKLEVKMMEFFTKAGWNWRGWSSLLRQCGIGEEGWKFKTLFSLFGCCWVLFRGLVPGFYVLL